jgi:hypothetical protein
MGTRSCIAVQHGDTIKAVYCHWDGYLDHNGRILQQHYDSAKANYLVALGDLSSLRAQLEPSKDSGHKFDNVEKGVCVFYGRDRGETGMGYKLFDNVADLMETYDACEYFYLMRDGQWWVSEGADFEPLSTALANLEEEQE